MPDFTYNDIYNSIIRNGYGFDDIKYKTSDVPVFFGSDYVQNENFNWTIKQLRQYVGNNGIMKALNSNIAIISNMIGANNPRPTIQDTLINSSFNNTTNYLFFGESEIRNTVSNSFCNRSDSIFMLNAVVSDVILECCLKQENTILSINPGVVYTGTWTTVTTANLGQWLRTSNQLNATAECPGNVWSRPFRYAAVTFLAGSSVINIRVYINNITVSNYIATNTVFGNVTGSFSFIFDCGSVDYHSIKIEVLNASTHWLSGFRTWNENEFVRPTILLDRTAMAFQWGPDYNATFPNRIESVEQMYENGCRNLQNFGINASFYRFKNYYSGLFGDTLQRLPIRTQSEAWAQELIDNCFYE
jgi:hypothetical protein